VLEMFDFSAERTLLSIEESITRMGCQYLDAIQIHDPEFAPKLHGKELTDPECVIYKETLPAMHQAKLAGKVRFVGITGFPLSIHKQMIENSPVPIDTCLSYCHYSMNDTSLKTELAPYLKEKNVALINASAISMGLLSSRGPPAWHPATAEIKKACLDACEYCKERDIDIGKLAMHFSMAEESIPTTLVSTASSSRIQGNIESVYELGQLSEAENQCMEEVLEKFFRPMNNATWEDVEPPQYAELLAKAQSGQDVGTLSTN